jgi:hypothetical protein
VQFEARDGGRTGGNRNTDDQAGYQRFIHGLSLLKVCAQGLCSAAFQM